MSDFLEKKLESTLHNVYTLLQIEELSLSANIADVLQLML
jgi:hypothetical protein